MPVMTTIDRGYERIAQDAMVGVHLDIPHEDYVHDPVPGGSLSATGVKHLLSPSCPAKYRWYRDHRQIKTEFDFGHAAHQEVLGTGPEIVVVQRTTRRTDPKTKEVTTTVEDATDRRTTSAQEHEKAIRAEGKVPLLAADWATVQEMAAALREDPLAGDLLDGALGKAEVTLAVRDPETGVMLRSRVDWLLNRPLGDVVAWDYKTTTCSEPSSLRRQGYEYGYHIQAAFYLHVLRLLGLATSKSRFLFLAQEKEGPFLTTWYEPDEDALAEGYARVREGIERYRDCTAADVWPGYTTDIVRLALPRYAAYRGEY